VWWRLTFRSTCLSESRACPLQRLLTWRARQVDRGVNPEKYTELAVNAAIERAALTRGRVLALEVFRDSLRAEMQQTLPELWQAYERQRAP